MTTIQLLLERFAEIKGEATNKESAVKLNKDTFIFVDKNFSYGGYRLTRKKIIGGSECGCYGISDISARMNTKVMEAYLRGLINSNNP